MSQAAKALALSGEDRGTLETWVNAHSTPQQIALRAQLILCAANGVANSVIADELGITRPTVLQWRKRFEGEGIDALTASSQDADANRKSNRPRSKQSSTIRCIASRKAPRIGAAAPWRNNMA